MNKKLILVLVGFMLTTTLTACNPKSNINGAKGEAMDENIKVSEVQNDNEQKNIDEENRGKKIAIEEIKKYFETDIDDTYEVKVNYYDYGDDSKYHQYLFWSDSMTFDIRVAVGEDKSFYLKQILPENKDGNALNKVEAEKLSLEFLKNKLENVVDNLVLINTDYEVEKNTSDIEYYIYQYNEKDNDNSGVFIKVDWYNKYVSEITLFN